MVKKRAVISRYREQEIHPFGWRDFGPFVTLGSVLVGVVVWAYSTFAPLAYVKEQNQQILTLIEQRNKEAIDHSDMNRDRMMSIMQDIKESIHLIQGQIFKHPQRDDRLQH